MSGAISRFVLLLTALCCGGCAGVPFTVEAVRTHAPDVHPLSYRIECVGKPASGPTMSYDHAESFTRAALSSKGMFEAPDGTTPEMIAEIDFGMDAPRVETRTYTTDIMGTVPESTRTVTETKKNPDGTTTTTTREVKEPAHDEKVGEETHEYEVMIFPMFFRISARENTENPAVRGRQLWSVYVTHEEVDCSDLDRFVPMMVAAAMDYIDRQTNEEKTVEIGEKDRRLTFVMRGMPTSNEIVAQTVAR